MYHQIISQIHTGYKSARYGKQQYVLFTCSYLSLEVSLQRPPCHSWLPTRVVYYQHWSVIDEKEMDKDTCNYRRSNLEWDKHAWALNKLNFGYQNPYTVIMLFSAKTDSLYASKSTSKRILNLTKQADMLALNAVKIRNIQRTWPVKYCVLHVHTLITSDTMHNLTIQQTKKAKWSMGNSSFKSGFIQVVVLTRSESCTAKTLQKRTEYMFEWSSFYMKQVKGGLRRKKSKDISWLKITLGYD